MPTIALADRLRAKLLPRTATVTSRTDLTASLVELWCTAPARFEPGDVLAVRVDGTGPGPTGTWRRYTVAGTDGPRFRLVLERNPAGAAARCIDSIRVGHDLTVRGPAKAVVPPSGDAPLLVVADLTGLATIAALIQSAHPDERVTAAIVSADPRVDVSIVAACVPVGSADCTVLRHHDHVADWTHRRAEDHGTAVRLLAVGEHDLTVVARHAARAAGVAHIRTRTYWKPGRRGLE